MNIEIRSFEKSFGTKLVYYFLAGITMEQICKVAGADALTVEKWFGGANYPHPAMQKVFFEELNKLLPKKIGA
jgi:hypothetical protein